MKKNLGKKGLVLCAGLGTRLRPLTLQYAKPALPVLGIPSVWFSVWHLSQSLQLRELAVNVGHAPETLRKVLDDAVLVKKTGANFFVSDESSQILGSSGVLWKLKDWIGSDTLFATNGDSIFYPNWKQMFEVHKSSGALMTLHVRSFDHGDGEFTDLQIDSHGRLLKLESKKKSGTMFSGAYILDASVIADIPAGVSELKNTVLDPLIKKQKLFTYKEDIAWFDTGTIPAYAKTQFELLKAEPRFQELIELKMKQHGKQVWVPKEWNETKLQLKAPAVLQGNASDWLEHGKEFGPNFIGIQSPTEKELEQNKNAIVIGDLQIHL